MHLIEADTFFMRIDYNENTFTVNIPCCATKNL